MQSSTIRDSGIRYSSTDCFDNFPFPQVQPCLELPELELVGSEYYEYRRALMVERNQGLTHIQNALKNPDVVDEGILRLRNLHEDMDRIVLNAYGWSDIKVPPYCPLNLEEEALVEAFNDEVIDRLYVLNAKRAVEEERSRALPENKAFGRTATKSNPTIDLF